MKEKICVKEVCLCIRDAICYEDEDCLFIPEDAKPQEIYLDVWDDSGGDDERVVIVNPIEEFEFDEKKYFRVIKTIGTSIWDFRDIEKKFGIYIYLRKGMGWGIDKYIFYYKGKQVYTNNCPPIFDDIAYLLRTIPELHKYRDELKAIDIFLRGHLFLRYI